MKWRGWLRHIKTTQERRRWEADLEAARLRRARSPRSLPSLWDDIQRHPQRSWKEQRRHKWISP